MLPDASPACPVKKAPIASLGNRQFALLILQRAPRRGCLIALMRTGLKSGMLKREETRVSKFEHSQLCGSRNIQHRVKPLVPLGRADACLRRVQ